MGSPPSPGVPVWLAVPVLVPVVISVLCIVGSPAAAAASAAGPARTVPGDYSPATGWSGSERALTSALFGPDGGSVTYAAGTEQSLSVMSPDTIRALESPSAYERCLAESQHTSGNDLCSSQVSVLRFSRPVLDPVLQLGTGGGSSGDGTSCALVWDDVAISAVNGGPVTDLQLMGPPGAVAWDGTTLGPEIAGGSCTAPHAGPAYVKVAGSVSSIQLTHRVHASGETSDGLPTGVAGGTTLSVLLHETEPDLGIEIAGPPALQPHRRIRWDLTVTNHYPDGLVQGRQPDGWSLRGSVTGPVTQLQTSHPGCRTTDGAIACDGLSTQAGTTTVITVTGVAESPGTVTNTVQLDPAGQDTYPSNNTAASAVTVAAEEVAVPLVEPRALAVLLALLALLGSAWLALTTPRTVRSRTQ